MATMTDEGLKIIRDLEDRGVLGPERCPDQYFWSWPVLKPDLLPQWLRDNYQNYGEIRWYWN